jgi:hypothetical protein
LVLALENPPNPLFKGECHFPPSRINLGTVKNFTAEARRTQRRHRERRFYVPPLFPLCASLCPLCLCGYFSFFILQCLNLRDSNPVRGEMFIETGTTKHISSSVGATLEIAARNTYRSYGAWWLSWSSYAINMPLLAEFRIRLFLLLSLHRQENYRMFRDSKCNMLFGYRNGQI